jgi:carboxypeptidase PM20D1
MPIPFSAALLLLVLVALLLLVRTLRYGVPVERPLPAPSPAVDLNAAAQRLALLLRCRTLSHIEEESIDPDPFLRLHKVLEESFPLVHQHLNRERVGELSLLYTWSGREPELKPFLLMAHQDVVPVETGTEDDWHYPPFSGEIADGFIWGRGTLDMKSALSGIFEAIELLLKDGFVPRRTIYVALGHDEEVGGFSGNARIAALLAERAERLEYVLDEGGFIVDGVIPGIREPVALVGIAEKGFVNFILTARGEGGHSAMPPGRSAIGSLSQALIRLERYPFPSRIDFIAIMFTHLGRRFPFFLRLILANLWLFGPLVGRLLARNPKINSNLRTTFAPTMLRAGVKENVLATEASAAVNVRILPGDTIASTLDRMNRIIGDQRVKITPTPGTEPSGVSPLNSPSYALLRRTILEAASDVSVAPYLVVGATDSRHYAGLTNQIYRFICARMESEDIQRLHGTNERISVEDHATVIAFYYRLITNSEAM